MFYIEGKYYSEIEVLKNISKEDIIILNSKGIIEILNIGLKFNFVGVISVKNMAFVVLPKTMKTEEELLLNTTIKTLKKYCSSNIQLFDGIDYFNIEPDDPDCSELAIAEFLINDFQEKGILIFKEELYKENGDGDISWSLTTDNIDPFYSKNQPIYINTINQIIIEDSYNLIVVIHKWSLGYVTKKYSLLLGDDIMQFHFDYEEDINEIGSLELLINYLQKQLQVIYSDREIRVIKSLLFLLRKKAGLLENDLSLYGTKKYESIWESICKVVVNDSYKGGSYFPNPQWNILGKNFSSRSILIPDITSEDPKTKNFYLFDAKYYSLKFDGEISGEPGYKDILKQFQYQHHIEKEIEKKISNAFLFPLNDDEYNLLKNNPNIIYFNEYMAVIGSLEYELYQDKKVWVIMCPFSKWQNSFILNKSIDYSKMYWKP